MEGSPGPESAPGKQAAPGLGEPGPIADRVGRERTPLELAFRVGQLLNRADWHLTQAGITGSRHHNDTAMGALIELETCFVSLFPARRGGRPRLRAKEMREDWDGALDTEWYAEHLHNCYSEANISEANESEVEQAKNKLISDLITPIPLGCEELTRLIRRRFRRTPKMWLALQLGACVDEGVCNPDIRAWLIERQQTAAWLAWSRRRRRARKADLGLLDTAPQRYRLVPAPKEPGEVGAAPGWDDEVRVLWESLDIQTALPCLLTARPEDPAGRRQLHEQLVVAALEGLSRIEDDGWGPRTGDKVWPPDDGWHFRDGEFAFLNRVGVAVGKTHKLLKTLALSRIPQRREGLIRAVWGDESPVGITERNNLRQQLVKVRAVLRKTFTLDKKSDPIPNRQGDVRGWWIDKDLIKKKINNTESYLDSIQPEPQHSREDH